MKLKRQGFFKEMPHGEESDPSILKFIQNEKNKRMKEICQYLKEGSVLVACGGIAQDVINPQNGGAGCPDMITDGIWIWPGDLAYYVMQYNLKLDEDFIHTMKENKWHVNCNTNIDFDNIEII